MAAIAEGVLGSEIGHKATTIVKNVWDGMTSWVERNEKEMKADAAKAEAYALACQQSLRDHQAAAPARIRRREEEADHAAGEAIERAISELLIFEDDLHTRPPTMSNLTSSSNSSDTTKTIDRGTPTSDMATNIPSRNSEDSSAGKQDSEEGGEKGADDGKRQPFQEDKKGDEETSPPTRPFGREAPNISHDEERIADRPPNQATPTAERQSMDAQGAHGEPSSLPEKGDLTFTIVYVTHSTSLRLALERKVRQWDTSYEFHPRRLVFSRLEVAITWLEDLAQAAEEYQDGGRTGPASSKGGRVYSILGADIERFASLPRKQYRIVLCDPTNGVDYLEKPRIHKISMPHKSILQGDALSPTSLVIVGQSEDDKPRFAIHYYDREGVVSQGGKFDLSWLNDVRWSTFRDIAFTDAHDGYYDSNPEALRETGGKQTWIHPGIKYDPEKQPAPVGKPPSSRPENTG